ncbi:MAG: DUF1826 domain-containing protein [Methylobacter sp.]|nr:DUF1826 domain-containing protein [Methylobacter sp.]
MLARLAPNYSCAYHSDDLADLSTIYEPNINMCVVERPIDKAVETFMGHLLPGRNEVSFVENIEPTAFDFFCLIPQLGHLPGYRELCLDIARLANLFSDLFDLKRVGLRLRTLDHPMCPRFHVDSVTCRLVCTYGGVGTQWLEDAYVDRSKLGQISAGLKDEQSGLILDLDAIHTMPAYAVGLLKGNAWEGNEQRGAVHRSPQVTKAWSRRLLLTLDFG